MAAPRPACALSALALVAGLVGCDDSAPTDAERGGLESMATRDAAVPDAGSDAGGDAGADAGRGALELRPNDRGGHTATVSLPLDRPKAER